MRRYRIQCKAKRYQACEILGSECDVTEVNTSRIGTQLVIGKASDCGVTEVNQPKRNEACELEGSVCGVTQVNVSSRRIRLPNWKAASAV